MRLTTGEFMNPKSMATPTSASQSAALACCARFQVATNCFKLHINAKELRAHFEAIRWRARASSQLGSRFAHLCDSQVVTAVLVKGRSPSRQSQREVRRVTAVQLAANLCLFHAFVSASTTPADKPSRWVLPIRPPRCRSCLHWKQSSWDAEVDFGRLRVVSKDKYHTCKSTQGDVILRRFEC